MRSTEHLKLLLRAAALASTGLVAGTAAKNDDSGSVRPRGVGPEFAKFYKSEPSGKDATFTCISHPSITVPFAAVNDDYCDCPDGSDEPGTSACSHLSDLSPHTPSTLAGRAHLDTESGGNTTPALPGFYCKNKGHRPLYVPFTRVNDGICDYDYCCDGSDEWSHVGAVKCENRCKEIGKAWRKEEETRTKASANASKKRKELVAQAGRLRLEVGDRVDSLKKEIEGAQIVVSQLESQLEEEIKKDTGRVFRGGSGKASKVVALAALARQRVDELLEALHDVRKQRDDARTKVKELEAILSTFHQEYNPNFNDEGVKRAVRSWEDYVADGKIEADGGDTARERDIEEISKFDSEESGINWSEWEAMSDEPAEHDADIVYNKLTAYFPPSLLAFVNEKLVSIKQFLVENGVLVPSSATDGTPGESKAVQDARSALKNHQKDLENIEKQLRDHTEDLTKDYGVDDVFRALKGQCMQKESGEYTYEVCWMDSTKQKSKKGGGDTRMGNFAGFGTQVVDAEAGEIGALSDGTRVATTLKYENGQKCWNGPSRMTTVVLYCGEADEILKIREEEKCIYLMEVKSPAACVAPAAEKEKEKARDEL